MPRSCSATASAITSALIERNVGISKDYNIFELQNAIGARDHLKAQTIAHYLASDKEHKLFLTASMLIATSVSSQSVQAGCPSPSRSS